MGLRRLGRFFSVPMWQTPTTSPHRAIHVFPSWFLSPHKRRKMESHLLVPSLPLFPSCFLRNILSMFEISPCSGVFLFDGAIFTLSLCNQRLQTSRNYIFPPLCFLIKVTLLSIWTWLGLNLLPETAPFLAPPSVSPPDRKVSIDSSQIPFFSRSFP